VLHPTVAVVRRVGVIGIAIAGAFAILAALGLVVSHRADEGTRIRRRYANVLVPVEGALAGAGSVVDVATFDGLERLATVRDRAILHGVEWGADASTSTTTQRSTGTAR
jgi:hypothetical protein